MRALGLVAMVLALAACGGAEQAKPVAEKQAAPASAVVASAPVAAASEEKQQASGEKISIDAIGITAKKLAESYDENEAAADEKYRGKYILVTGKIAMIDKGMADEINIQLEGKDFQRVIGHLQEVEKKSALELKKKQTVTLLCEGAGEIAGTPILKDCLINTDYTVEDVPS